jgi:hypothetical protein
MGLRIVLGLPTLLTHRALNLRKKRCVGQAVVPSSRKAMAGRTSASSVEPLSSSSTAWSEPATLRVAMRPRMAE